MSKYYKAFWTGGWDSTFMILEQLIKGNDIEPIYILDSNRTSKDIELEHIDIIKDLINKRNFNGKLLPLKIINLEDIKGNKEITDAYYKIKTETDLGSQHEWLAWYAYENPGIMIGVEKGSADTHRMIDTMNKYCVLKEQHGNKVVDKDNSTTEGNLVLGNLIFPIIDITEQEMNDLVHEWKIEDIMQNIWFCHKPINGRPCGMCRPCEVKIDANMEFLLPKRALNNYKKVQFMYKYFGKYGKSISNKILRYIGSK